MAAVVALILVSIMPRIIIPAIRGQLSAPAFWIGPVNETFNTTATPMGIQFNVTVWAATPATDSYGYRTFLWQVMLGFNTTQLNAVAAGFTDGATSMLFAGHKTVTVGPVINNTVGYVLIGELLQGSDSIGAENASVFWVTFELNAYPAPGTNFTSLIDPGYGAAPSRGETFFWDVELFNETPLSTEPCTYTYVYNGPPRVDNLIITTTDLEPAALNLATWKNVCGIRSLVLDVRWIYSHYSGVDNPEKIRNCIKDFYNSCQIKYVTIFGDADKVPTRLVYTPDINDNTNFTATDLYYACLNGTWDDNHDGLYADLRYDNIDATPEVCIGRIPVSLPQNAQPIVDKIVNYQQQFNPSQNWTKRIVLAAGTGNNGVENTLGTGPTVLNDYIANITTNKNIVKLYEEAGNLSTDSMMQQINQGALFVDFAGHGDPGSTPIFSAGWLFYWVVTGLIWNGFGIPDVRSTTNGARLPVVTTMSCSTARFDDADCIGEWFVGYPNGGAIAYFGSTRISYSYANNSSPYGLMGEMDRRIYENFYKGFTRLGQMWGESVSEYVAANPLQQIFTDEKGNVVGYLNEKTAMEFVLLGDPTLRIYNGPETLKVPDNYATIQGAINDAYDGDTIEVAPGTYHETIVINKTVSLVGMERETTRLENGEIDIKHDGVNIANFTLGNSDSCCISLADVQNCNVSGNVIYDSDVGILLTNSNHNQVSGNSVTNCSSCAIYLDSSKNNLFTGDNITGNIYGMAFISSPNNTLYDNNFVYNMLQVLSFNSTNTWDNNYPSGGNYWSDYSGADLFSGLYQNETGSDGIGDTPYIIAANNRDNYPLVTHDFSVREVKSSKTVIGQGYALFFNVTVANGGNCLEEFNVTLYANATSIATQIFTLANGNATTTIFQWNTTGFAYGNYTLSAYALPVPGETNTANNNFTDGWVYVSIIGDITGGSPNALDFVPDGKVDMRDVGVVARFWGQNVPPAPSNCDVTGPTQGVPDGKIDMRDIGLVARNFGEHYP